MKIGIIGTRNITSPSIFDRCVKMARSFLASYSEEQIELISGGSSGADHIAVALSDTYPLILYGPCKWDGDKYEDNGSRAWQSNPGGTLNYYHTEFSSILGYSSLSQIKEGIDTRTITYVTQSGFHSRNTSIAKCDILLAFTSDPMTSGTLNTWNQCQGIRYHIVLHDMSSSNVA